jgi:hypothetical protein
MARDIVGTDTYGGGAYQIPEDTDKGNDVFSVLETYLERMATHTHGGTDSTPISLNIEKDIELFVAGSTISWNNEGNDVYKSSSLETPAAGGVSSVDDNIRKFYYTDGTTWREFFPTVEKQDSTHYFIYASTPLAQVRVVTL